MRPLTTPLNVFNGVFAAGTDPAGKPRYGSAAVVSVDPKTGAVPYMVAGPGFQNYKYNLVTQNKRQTGSSFKTFVLATAMERGYSPEDQIDGTGPCLFKNPTGTPDPYPAENFGGLPVIISVPPPPTPRTPNPGRVPVARCATNSTDRPVPDQD